MRSRQRQPLPFVAPWHFQSKDPPPRPATSAALRPLSQPSLPFCLENPPYRLQSSTARTILCCFPSLTLLMLVPRLSALPCPSPRPCWRDRWFCNTPLSDFLLRAGPWSCRTAPLSAPGHVIACLGSVCPQCPISPEMLALSLPTINEWTRRGDLSCVDLLDFSVLISEGRRVWVALPVQGLVWLHGACP